MGLSKDWKGLSKVVVTLDLHGLRFLCDLVGYGLFFLNLRLLWLHNLSRLLLNLEHQSIRLHGHLLQLRLLLIQVLPHLLHFLRGGQELLDSSLISCPETQSLLALRPQ